MLTATIPTECPRSQQSCEHKVYSLKQLSSLSSLPFKQSFSPSHTNCKKMQRLVPSHLCMPSPHEKSAGKQKQSDCTELTQDVKLPLQLDCTELTLDVEAPTPVRLYRTDSGCKAPSPVRLYRTDSGCRSPTPRQKGKKGRDKSQITILLLFNQLHRSMITFFCLVIVQNFESPCQQAFIQE